MTLIGAMDCKDYLLFAADNEITADDLRSPTKSKIRRVQNPPLAWAIAGEQGLGAQFSDWLEARTRKAFVPSDPLTPTPWEQLKLEAANYLNGLNGQRRYEVNRAKGAPNNNLLAWLLLAGYVGGRFEVLEIDINGAAGFTKAHGHTFVGVGREATFALAAMRRVLAKHGIELPNGVEALREVMELAHELLLGVGAIEMVQVTKEGIIDVPTGSGLSRLASSRQLPT